MIADVIWEYMEARRILEKAKSDCDHSWGYFLYDEIERVDRLAQEIEDTLKEKKNEAL